MNEVYYRVGLVNKQRAYRLLRAVLHSLRDQLTPDTAAHLSAQLPIFERGIFYEGNNPSGMPAAIRDKDDSSPASWRFSAQSRPKISQVPSMGFSMCSTRASRRGKWRSCAGKWPAISGRFSPIKPLWVRSDQG